MLQRDHDHLARRGARLSRRRFLAASGTALSTAWAVPTIVPASALGANGTVAQSNRIGVGMIGLGRQAIATICRCSHGRQTLKWSHCVMWIAGVWNSRRKTLRLLRWRKSTTSTWTRCRLAFARRIFENCWPARTWMR